MVVLLFLFCHVLHMRLSLDVIISGIAVSALVSLFAYKVIGLNFKHEMGVYKKIPKIFAYLARLVIEVVKANIHVIALILSSKVEIKPQLIYFNSPLQSDGAKVALANSITLTPGTITVELEGDRFGVHAIDEKSAEGITESVFVKKLKNIQGGSHA